MRSRMLPKNGVPSVLRFSSLGREVRDLLKTATQSVEVYCPYITRAALEDALVDLPKHIRVQIITTWKATDLAFGSSDLSIYPFCIERGYSLALAEGLHLKTYLVDGKVLLTGSANLTGRGMGHQVPSNYETLVLVNSIGADYLSYLEMIKSRAFPVTAEIYEQLSVKLKELKVVAERAKQEVHETDDWISKRILSKEYFRLQNLPRSRSLEDLHQFLNQGHHHRSIEAEAFIHDIQLFALESLRGAPFFEFRDELRKRFFQNAFVNEVCNFIDQPRRFGEVKAFVQSRCSDQPTPHRRDLTGLIQAFYAWLSVLGADRFQFSRPNITEVISPKSSTKRVA